ncbi:substrate-binding domain-containing protein [Spongiivirga citrea]|uniref:ABC transporter substrate-binding protein n=1 Tax=Spongiivirga citrea TaxID=1481457 RepID=A0A6M0CCX8_9FLAO|nr:substrate-binding domain-containing protein [Spongiivirga citrea]NER15635.1 ABC transporter substrate-binding protein [Spongiivirga citrea]
MTTIKVGGVPEHFNLPWHLCIEDGSFERNGVQVEWETFPGGTGAMCKALRAGEIDAAVVLTEGIVKDIAEGNPSKIAQVYVGSPLSWGIHVGAKSSFKNEEDLKGQTIAISRYGSGSHLMAYVHAQGKKWPTNDLKFQLVNNLSGAVNDLTNGQADYFLWEQFTTKPLVDEGVFRRVGVKNTPWPCFVLAIRNEILDTKENAVSNMIETLNNCTQDFKNIPSIDITLANRYEQKLEDIQEWLSRTHWSAYQLKESELQKILGKLNELSLIQTSKSLTEIDFLY